VLHKNRYLTRDGLHRASSIRATGALQVNRPAARAGWLRGAEDSLMAGRAHISDPYRAALALDRLLATARHGRVLRICSFVSHARRAWATPSSA
jgi:hypothetical protein